MKYPKIKLNGDINVAACDLRLVKPAKLGIEIDVRTGGCFANHAYFLSDEWDWILGKDDDDVLVLIPIKKQYDNQDDNLDTHQKTWY